jgi:integrase
MATFEKRNGRVRARVRINGHPKSKSFSSLKEARAWARQVEAGVSEGSACENGEARLKPRTTPTLREALLRYRDEVTDSKRGAAQERRKVSVVSREPLASRPMAEILPQDIATWRNRMVARGLAASTINIALSLVSQVFETARVEWAVPVTNPVRGVRRPPARRGRDRVVTREEEARLIVACTDHWLGSGIVLAVETAMRRSELLGLRWEDVRGRIAIVRQSKNGRDRAVPLSRRAMDTLERLPRSVEGRVIPLSVDEFTGRWRRARARAGLHDVAFHALRHTAATRMIEGGLTVVEVMQIGGWRTYSQMLRYTHLSVGALGEKLDAIR